MKSLKEHHNEIRGGKCNLSTDIQQLVTDLVAQLEGYQYDVTENFVDIKFGNDHFLIYCKANGYSFTYAGWISYGRMNLDQLLRVLAKFLCIEERRL